MSRLRLTLLSVLTIAVAVGVVALLMTAPATSLAGADNQREPEPGPGRPITAPWFSFSCADLRDVTPQSGAPLFCTSHALNGFDDPLDIACKVPDGMRCELDRYRLTPTADKQATLIGLVLDRPGVDPGSYTVSVIATPPDKPYLPGPLAPLRVDLPVVVKPGPKPAPRPTPNLGPDVPGVVDHVVDEVRPVVRGDRTVKISCPAKITVPSTGTTTFTCTLTPVNGYPWAPAWYGSVPGSREDFYFELHEGGFQEPFQGKPRQATMVVETGAVPQGTYPLTVSLSLNNPPEAPPPTPKTVIQATVPAPTPSPSPAPSTLPWLTSN
ncbi:MAG: hypothetical protein WD646_10225 [Actinomycetota bacterium]